jgi:phospholipid transport system substrate-binding protein
MMSFAFSGTPWINELSATKRALADAAYQRRGRETKMTMWMGVAIAAAWLMMAGTAVASPAVGPSEAVESAIVQILNVLSNGEAEGAPVADRSAEVRRLTRDLFDFEEISRRALARHWQELNTDEQTEFVTLFRDLLERVYMGQLGSYSGEKITFVGEVVEGDVATVRSKVVTKKGTEIPLDYRMHTRDGRWYVHDVKVGGFSFVGSYRYQFDRVIRTESYAALRGRLQKKTLDTAVAQTREQGL